MGALNKFELDTSTNAAVIVAALSNYTGADIVTIYPTNFWVAPSSH